MSIRAIDSNGDWTFGSGLNNYKTGQLEIAQTIQNQCLSFLNNCFFDVYSGIDWFSYLSGDKNQLDIQLAVSAQILAVQNVTGIQQVNVNFNTLTRALYITYNATTVYSTITGQFSYNFSSLI